MLPVEQKVALSKMCGLNCGTEAGRVNKGYATATEATSADKTEVSKQPLKKPRVEMVFPSHRTDSRHFNLFIRLDIQ